jgi:hypothetical protein
VNPTHLNLAKSVMIVVGGLLMAHWASDLRVLEWMRNPVPDYTHGHTRGLVSVDTLAILGCLAAALRLHALKKRASTKA